MWSAISQPTSPTDYGRPCPRRNRRVRSSPLQPYAIVAGAGSGKTQTMGLRVAWLVANGQVEPQRVLGLTFTRKAAAELSQRIRRMLRGLVVADERDPFLEPDVAAALAAGEPTVSTYHAYAAALVSEHALRAGSNRPRLLGEAMTWQYATRRSCTATTAR